MSLQVQLLMVVLAKALQFIHYVVLAPEIASNNNDNYTMLTMSLFRLLSSVALSTSSCPQP